MLAKVTGAQLGFHDAATMGDPKLVAVAEISQDNGLPGMQEARRPMRPHRGTTGPVMSGRIAIPR